MTEGYTKLLSSITESTIWSEDNETRIVWITMLAMADHVGYIGASVPGLAARARVSLEATEVALAKFLAPDKYSRNSEYEGRRIAVVDRGWKLLNYKRFCYERDDETRKAYKTKWQAGKRSESDDGKSYVYFALDSRGLVKIGWSTNPLVRVTTSALRDAGAVGKVTLLGQIVGTKEGEKQLQMRFGDQWVEGEWYRYEGELAEFIKTIVDKASPQKTNDDTKNRGGPTKTETETETETETKTKTRKREESLPLPPALDSESMREAWKNWIGHRKQLKKPMTTNTVNQLHKKFLEWGEQRSIAAIEHTVCMGWQGLREPEGSSTKPVIFSDLDLDEARAQRERDMEALRHGE